MIVDETEIIFSCAALYGRVALRPHRQVAFLVTPFGQSYLVLETEGGLHINVFSTFVLKTFLHSGLQIK